MKPAPFDPVRSARRSPLDSLGIALAGLCVVHCVASALLLATVAASGGALLSPAIHEIGLVVAIGIAALSLLPGVLRSRDLRTAALGVVGLAVMAAALAFHGSGAEVALTLLGVAMVAGAHALNRQPHCAAIRR